MKPPAARIYASLKTCQAPLSKWAQTHLREKSPGAAANRLIETPIAKSLIFQAYSLNISLWGAKLSYSVLNSWGMEARQQNNSQLQLRSLGVNNKPSKPLPSPPKKPWMTEAASVTFWYEPRSFFFPLSHAWGEDILRQRRGTVEVKTWLQELSPTLQHCCKAFSATTCHGAESRVWLCYLFYNIVVVYSRDKQVIAMT